MGLWITLAVLVVLLALGGAGGVFAYAQYRAPQDAALQFCNVLQRQDYVAAYDQLSTGLRSQYSEQDFTDGAAALDQAEGKVTSCGQSTTGGGYSYTLFGKTATVAIVVSRATQGTLRGALHLASEGGSWKVDALDTSLLGVPLGALKAASAFCAALRAGDASGAYALLGSALQAGETEVGFANKLQLHQKIDGAVTACALEAVAQGNSDTSAALKLSITHATLGARQGAMSLDVEGGSWKISALDAALSGSDLRPFGVANSYCTDLEEGNIQAVYGLFSTAFQARYSFTQVKGFFTLTAGDKFAGCKPHFDTYKVSNTTGTFQIDVLIENAAGEQFIAPTTLYFVLEGQDWKIDDFQLS
jgi:hypothetical protein